MKKYNYIASAKRTLKIESDSIKSISNQLDASFTSLCECIINSKGALIVMGVGKSGHIGQKLHLLFQVQVLHQYLFIQLKLRMEIWA